MPLQIKRDQPLSEHSTFGIGGAARYFASVQTSEEMSEAFLWAKKEDLPVFILGKGSNCLFADRGFNGLVVHNRIDFCKVHEGSVSVGAGYSFSLLGTQLARSGFSGLEFAAGIPGSVGGAVYMNAGAGGGETSTFLTCVDFLSLEGEKKSFKKEELLFSYRTSPFQKMEGAIVSASFSLPQDLEARKRQITLIDQRKKTQPLQEKSAGCIFRNPSSSSAGALIDQCGLKGLSMGGAKVSEKHANFIVNAGNSRAEDVSSLIQEIKKVVQEKKGISLETEICFIPFDPREK